MDLWHLLKRHCMNGVYESFEYLLTTRIICPESKRLDILQIRDKYGYTLLHYAAEGGSTRIFKKLMDSDSRFDFGDKTYLGHTILHLACKSGRNEVCNFLLSDDRVLNELLNVETKQMWNAAHFAAISGDVNILTNLEHKDINIKRTKNDLCTLDIACIMKNDKMCEKLIQSGQFTCDQDRHDWNIAHYAARVGNKYVLELLKENNVDNMMVIKKTGSQQSVLHICCEYGHYDVCELITQNYKKIIHDVDNKGWNALHFAAKGGNLSVLKLIEESLDPDKSINSLCIKTHDGKTALHISCIHKNLEICEYLCSRFTKDKINIKTKVQDKNGYGGWNAAHYVAVEIKQDGSEEKLLDLLVKSGIDIKEVTAKKYSVLAVACEHKNKRLVKHLLNNYQELLDVEISILKTAAINSCDEEIIEIIDKALQEKVKI